MNIYANISIYAEGELLNRNPYKLVNENCICYWKYLRFYEARSIEHAYKINIVVASTDRYLYNFAPNIPFDNKHLECPLVERGKW